MSRISSTTRRYYHALRVQHGIRAYQALQMAQARYDCEQNGVEFLWMPEDENPRDVFGEPCTDKHCHKRSKPCMGVHYNADREHYFLSLELDGLHLASLGMIEDDGLNGYRSYRWLVECELAVEAVAAMPIFEEVL